jgi:hypothetical protein
MPSAHTQAHLCGQAKIALSYLLTCYLLFVTFLAWKLLNDAKLKAADYLQKFPLSFLIKIFIAHGMEEASKLAPRFDLRAGARMIGAPSLNATVGDTDERMDGAQVVVRGSQPRGKIPRCGA